MTRLNKPAGFRNLSSMATPSGGHVKLARIIGLPLFLLSGIAAADPSAGVRADQDMLGVISDIIIVRPIAVVGTLAGAAVLVGTLPFSALASIAPPHDAISRAAGALVGVPACYAFKRPLGGPFSGQDAEDQRPCVW
jgi:hypothetical protein